MSNFFSKCNMAKLAEFTIVKEGEEIPIPFFFHIGKIFDSFPLELNNSLYIYSEQDENSRNKEIIVSWFEDIDLKNFTIDECVEGIDMVYTDNGYIFKDSKQLYNFLITQVGLTDNNLYDIKEFVQENRMELVSEFRDMVIEELKLEVKKMEITEAFMVLRASLEHCVPPIFPENIGKTISEYSWRELFVQRLYLARKSELEEIAMEEAKKNNKEK